MGIVLVALGRRQHAALIDLLATNEIVEFVERGDVLCLEPVRCADGVDLHPLTIGERDPDQWVGYWRMRRPLGRVTVGDSDGARPELASGRHTGRDHARCGHRQDDRGLDHVPSTPHPEPGLLPCVTPVASVTDVMSDPAYVLANAISFEAG